MTHRSPHEAEGRSKVVLPVVVAVIASVATYGLWRQDPAGAGPAANTPPTTVVMATSAARAPERPVAPAPPSESGVLTTSFDELDSELGADIGLAYAPLGEPDRVNTLGEWSHGPAWSTIKVPLALAHLQESGGVTSAMRSAITASDNAAAQSMWEDLGGGSVAAGKVQRVLAAAGDPSTVVPSEQRRPGFSIFGQTDWSLSDQARFIARTACDSTAAPVTTLMGEIVAGQRWGLGRIDGTSFKGGWGPGTDGLYLVRQFGVVPTRSGGVAVAVAAVSDSGGFGDGTAVLDRLADWLEAHLADIGGGRCPTG